MIIGGCMYQISDNVRRLTNKEKQQYSEQGYVKNLPVFSYNGALELQGLFEELSSRLPSDVDINKTNMWHKASKKFHDLCRTPEILDYVEDILGPNFVQWGGQFFHKEPKSGSVVPWHQDAQYWPLKPANAVTVWLAVYDTDKENGAMKVVSGSHKKGSNGFKHHTNNASHLVLDQEVSEDQIDQDNIVYMDLKAGEISLHNDALLHGSDPNNSDRRRCGITMRFSPTNVKGDLNEWPFFETQLARGIDSFKLNPIAQIPRGEATPIKRFCYSKDFEKDW
jgi:non-heme Fe2+,alpha-ketoglutarate-dependent halogenase|tara:strand:- start:219 stop:1058 length:840 start_codon:yes stop_codon:yes gene_type:complete